MGLPHLIIPNEVVKTIMYEYIRSSFQTAGAFSMNVFKLNELESKMAYLGDFKPLINFLADEIKKQTRIRDYLTGEKVIQSFFLAYLNIIDFYVSLSEEELNKGYADLILKPFYYKYPDIGYAYLFEFKYIKRTEDVSELTKKLMQKIAESEAQLQKYAHDDFAQKMLYLEPYATVKLKKGIIIFNGWELVYLEEYNT